MNQGDFALIDSFEIFNRTFVNSALSSFGVPFGRGQIFFLFRLARDGKATPGAIAKEMGVRSGRITRFLKDMERRGYIKKKADSHDKRRYIVVLTDKGKKTVAMMKKKMVDFGGKVIRAYGEDDFRKLLVDLGRLKECFIDAQKEKTHV